MFPEATRQGLSVGDHFVPANVASASALMQAGMLRAGPEPVSEARRTLKLSKPGGANDQRAREDAPRNKDASSFRRNK